MKPEIEAKFLDIDPEAIRAKLKNLGASLIHPETLTRQKVFDFPDFKLDKDYSWLRLRDENGEISLTLKKWQKDGGVDGMQEVTFTVGSYEEAEKLLLAVGMVVKSTQMKKRELWKLGNVEFMIDTWPWIPTFLEIEGQTNEDVEAMARTLDFEWSKAKFGGVARIYKHYFNIEFEEIDRYPEITFSDVPKWLELKRIAN